MLVTGTNHLKAAAHRGQASPCLKPCMSGPPAAHASGGVCAGISIFFLSFSHYFLDDFWANI